MMSFTGSIGSVMNGSGLADCLQTVFGSSTVPKIIDGKAIAKALRAHFLVQASLMTKLNSHIIPACEATHEVDNTTDNLYETIQEELELEEEDDFEEIDLLVNFDETSLRHLKIEEVQELKEIYEALENNYEEGVKRLHSSQVVDLLTNMLNSLKENLQTQSHTAKLWLKYMAYVDVLKQFIRAERCGDWVIGTSISMHWRKC